MGRECGDTHRDDRPLSGREGADGRQELVGATPVHDPQDGVAALGQTQCALASILRFLVALHESTANQPIDQATRRRWRPADRFGQLADRQGVAVGQDVQGRKLGEAEPKLPELAGEPDDQFAPERPTHRHPFADLADVRQAIAGGQDGRGQVRLEPAREGSGWRGPRGRSKDKAIVGHGGSVRRPRNVCNPAWSLGVEPAQRHTL